MTHARRKTGRTVSKKLANLTFLGDISMRAHTETTGIYFAYTGRVHLFTDMSVEEKAIWERLLQQNVQEAFKVMFTGINNKVTSIKAFRSIYPEISLQHAVWFYNDIIG